MTCLFHLMTCPQKPQVPLFTLFFSCAEKMPRKTQGTTKTTKDLFGAPLLVE